MSGEPGSLLLAGDVGGTKTDLAVVSAAAGPREPLARQRYRSADHPGLEDMVRRFLAETGMQVDAACVDVAGPVIGATAELTNLPWRLDEASLAQAAGVPRAWLLNDLVATAGAVPLLGPDELHCVRDGEPVSGGAIAVLAPGTGLGEAFLVREGEAGYRPHPSEGGHAAFSAQTDLEIELLRELLGKYEHVSAERVASGIGIPNLYDFLCARRGGTLPAQLAAGTSGVADRTRPILDAALDGPDPDQVARATVDLFLGILGTEAANLALKVLATGGVYLAGGVAQRLRDELRGPAFRNAMTRSGRFSDLLERLPVFVITGDVALLGAAAEGLRRLGP